MREPIRVTVTRRILTSPAVAFVAGLLVGAILQSWAG